jgi:8-oxo-dGTP diphosphatase
MIEIAGGLVWNRKLGIAVVNQNHNSWSLPKGHVEAGEDLISAAKREIEEETGIPREALTLIGRIIQYERTRIKRHENDSDEMRHMTFFLFTTTHEKLTPHDPENPEARWVSPRDVPDLLTHHTDKEQLRCLIIKPLFQQLIKEL